MSKSGLADIVDLRFGQGWKVDRVYWGSQLIWLSPDYIQLGRIRYELGIEDVIFEPPPIEVDSINYELTLADLWLRSSIQIEEITFTLIISDSDLVVPAIPVELDSITYTLTIEDVTFDPSTPIIEGGFEVAHLNQFVVSSLGEPETFLALRLTQFIIAEDVS